MLSNCKKTETSALKKMLTICAIALGIIGSVWPATRDDVLPVALGICFGSLISNWILSNMKLAQKSSVIQVTAIEDKSKKT